MEYTAEQRIAKLVKLRELAEHKDTPMAQADAARGLLEKLIRQWEVDPSELESEQVEKHFISFPPNGKMLACQVAWHMELKVFNTTRRGRLAIEATATDFALFSTYYESLLKALKDKQQRQKLELSSYMRGLSQTAFPSTATCSKCGSQAIRYVPAERRVVCVCGYKSRPIKPKPADMEAMARGAADGAKVSPDRLITA